MTGGAELADRFSHGELRVTLGSADADRSIVADTLVRGGARRRF